jgi:hypothetical protein
VSGARFTGSGLALTGTAGNYASSPNAAPLQITGDIDLRCKVALDDWTPSTENDLIAKEVTSTTRAYRFYVLPSGVLGILVSFNGTDQITAQSSVATGITDGSTKWVRATRVASTGLVRFFLSDDGTSWTQLGTDQSTTAGSIFNSSSSLNIGSRWAGASFQLKGTVYRAQIRNGIAGTVVFDANFEGVSQYATSVVESSANAAVVTLNTTYRPEKFGDGAWSLELTRGPIPADDGRALSNPRPAVIPGQTYTASALIDGYTNGGSIGLYFYNSLGNGVGQVNGSYVPAGVTALSTISMVAPPTSASAGLIIATNSTTGATRFDNMGIWAGAGGDWALPGVPITGINPTIVYSDLKSPSVNSSSYNWSSSADMTAKTRGEWTYTFTVSTDGDYSGSYLDFDLSPDSKSKVQIKYNTDVSYTECRRGKFLPSMPYSGTYPAVAQGPITLQVVLESENVIKNVAQLGFVEVSVYADNILGGNHKLGDATLSGSSASVRPGAFIPGESRKRLNCTFSGTGNIVIPGATAGAHRAIEMTFIVEGTRSATGVLASTTGNQINISPSNVVTATGSSWPTGSIYLNGVALSAGSATAKSDSVNHLLIVGSTGSTGSLYINSKNDNSLYVSGTAQYSSYGYLATWATGLTSDQITDILASRNGIVTSQPNMTPDAIAFSEPANATRVNITPWQTVLST